MVAETIKRYIVFIMGLFVSAIGVGMITQAGLGTSPVTSLAYVLSLGLPLSIGFFTAAQNIVLVAIQIAIEKKSFPKIQYLQIVVAVIFGWFVDLGMAICSFVQPESYIAQIFWLLLGCVILALGLVLEFAGDVLILPGEGLVRVLHKHYNFNLGSTKVALDCTMVAVAAVMSLILMHGIFGLREGTVIAAFLVGNIVRLLAPVKRLIEQRLECHHYEHV